MFYKIVTVVNHLDYFYKGWALINGRLKNKNHPEKIGHFCSTRTLRNSSA